jgi:hemolysin III
MLRRTSDPDEYLNVITHGFGVVAAITGTAILVVLASLRGDVWEVVGVSVFGTSAIVLYGASTLYHAASDPARKARLQYVDLGSIYLLIAGTYTPFMIDELRGGWGWSLFGVIWGLAVVGTLLQLRYAGRFPQISTALYVAMGWLVLIGAVPLVQSLPTTALVWLILGGIAYTAGTPFFLMSDRKRWAHPVWHLFVLAGTACHAGAVAGII